MAGQARRMRAAVLPNDNLPANRCTRGDRLPAHSLAGELLAPPPSRFHAPLIEPDGRISRLRNRNQL